MAHKTLTALITGATSGIGEAIARAFVQNKINVIICGRREERLQKLADELQHFCKVETLCFDVRDKVLVKSKIAGLPEDWKNIDILVNNAGNAHGRSSIQDGNLEDWDAMIDINVKGLLYVSKEVMPLMISQDSGHIVNIGSIAGKEVYPNGNVYCASKHAVDAITKGMRMDLNPHKIKVTSINPGAVDTEFSLVRFKGDVKKAEKVYEGYTPLYAKDIADIVYFVVSRPAHVQIADLLVLPTAQASPGVFNKNI